jgi:hypothetical protein
MKFKPRIEQPIERMKIPKIAINTERSGPRPYRKAPTKINIPASFGKLLERIRAMQKRIIPIKIVLLAIPLNTPTSELC